MAEIRDRGVLQTAKCNRKGEMNFAKVYQRQILRLGGIMAQQSPPAFSGSELISLPGEITGLGKVPNS